MKTLLLIRHAKAAIDSTDGTDFGRPLADRGHKDAATMAARLLEEYINIDLFVSSTAMRALSTCNYFFTAFKKTQNTKMIKLDELYAASSAAYYAVINEIPNEFNTIALVAHNPGITDFVNSLQVARLDNMPTCGIFAVETDIDTWANFQAAPKRFLLFDYPKNI
jgi:phosphohistidine phosphatase